MADLYKKTAVELSALIRQKQVKPSEVCESFISRYDETENKVNAYISLDKEAVMASAKELDGVAVTAETGSVFGIPVAVKDNICTKGTPTTCASKMLKNFTPPYDATVVSRLKEKGAVVFGKLNLDEFAMGTGNNATVFETAKNPHDLTRTPGGSSSGSAAAVAAGSALFALGSDTGGSIRVPAAYCGTVGYKPSYGAVSRYGLVAYAGSFDQIGPLARTVADAALLTAAIAGHDKLDAKSNPKLTLDFANIENAELKGKKFGYVEECFNGVDEDTKLAIEAAIKTYESLGAVIERVSLPLIENSLPMYFIIGLAEASSSFARLDGVSMGCRAENAGQARNKDGSILGAEICSPLTIDDIYINSRTEGFGSLIKQRIWLGTYFLSAGNYEKYFEKAQIARVMLQRQLGAAFEKCDALITPAAPSCAPKLGEKVSPAQASLADKCTVFANLAGLPAIALPCGKSSNGMPIGLQLVGRQYDDVNLLGFARALERENNFANEVAEVAK